MTHEQIAAAFSHITDVQVTETTCGFAVQAMHPCGQTLTVIITAGDDDFTEHLAAAVDTFADAWATGV